MSFRSFLTDFFRAPTINVSVNGDGYADSQLTTATVAHFATFAVIEIIAGICSKAEYKVYQKNKEFKGAEWYNLNVKPNVNQSSTEFWREAVANLLYAGEVLIVPIGTQKIIAEGFTPTEYALRETTFTGIYRNGFTFNKAYKASEVIYIKYSNADVTVLLNGIYATYTKLFDEATNKYIASGGQKGTLEIPSAAMGAPDFENKYKDLLNNRFKSFYKAKNAVLPLWNGMKYTPAGTNATAKSSSEIADIKALFDESITRAAQAYKFPPQLVRGEVSGINDALDYMLTICIDPLLNCISEELSGKEFSQDEYLNGNYIEADTTNIKHVDIFSLAPNVDKLISSGFANIDETREKAGMKATGEEWAKKHYITKNYENIENLNAAGGGEK